MKDNTLEIKSRKFARRIVRLNKYLIRVHSDYVMSNQILRCGTSIGANIAESVYAQSRKDFVNKMCIARKEAYETDFWMNLLRDEDYINEDMFNSMIADCHELLKLLTASIKTTLNGKEEKPLDCEEYIFE